MRETFSAKRERVLHMIDIFDRVYDDAACTLDYKNALQLLIATQLAAQCTDARVNIVTKDLFVKYPDVYAFANADELTLQEDIRSTGFFRNKAKNIIGCCNMTVRFRQAWTRFCRCRAWAAKRQTWCWATFSGFPAWWLIRMRPVCRTAWG